MSPERIKPETLVLFLATAWGPKRGGTNAFNYSLATAVYAEAPASMAVACVVVGEDAQGSPAFGGPAVLRTANREPSREELLELLPREHRITPTWIVGHDVHTGPLANSLCQQDSLWSSLLVLHTSPSDYAHYKHPNERAAEKVLQLLATVKAADRVAAVGPLLASRARELRASAAALLPGLQFLHPTWPTERLVVTLAGRFEPEDEPVKNLRLATESVLRAWTTGRRGGHSPRFAQPLVLQLIGAAGQLDLASFGDLPADAVKVMPFPFIEDRETYLDLLRSSNLVIIPSTHEGFGLVGWEAIGAGIPILIGKDSGVVQLLDELLPNPAASVLPLTLKPNQRDDNARELEARFSVAIASLDNLAAHVTTLRDTLIHHHGLTWRATAKQLINLIAPTQSPLSLRRLLAHHTSPAKSGGSLMRRVDTVDAALAYLIDRFSNAREQIDHASFAPPIAGWEDWASHYETAVHNVVAEQKIYYRYLGGLALTWHDRHRLIGITRLLELVRDPSRSRFLAAGWFDIVDVTGLNFILFDRKELFLYFPASPGEPGHGFTTSDPYILAAYRDYFQTLWLGAQLISDAAAAIQLADRLQSMQEKWHELGEALGLQVHPSVRTQ